MKTSLLTTLAIGAALLTGGAAHAADTIPVCVKKSNGAARFSSLCKRNEVLVQIPLEGPQGPQGPQGPRGDTGPQGPQGPAGSSGSNAAITQMQSTVAQLQSDVTALKGFSTQPIPTIGTYDDSNLTINITSLTRDGSGNIRLAMLFNNKTANNLYIGVKSYVAPNIYSLFTPILATLPPCLAEACRYGVGVYSFVPG